MFLIPHGITCYSLTSVLNFSILFSVLSYGSYKEDFSTLFSVLSYGSYKENFSILFSVLSYGFYKENFSILFSVLLYGFYKENFSNNEDLLSFSRISFILMILMGE